MRYYRHNEEEFLINGHSHVRVRTLDSFRRPASPNRVLKVLTVLGAVKQSPANQIQRGALLCLSFPEMEANTRNYRWKQKDRDEECQVNLKVQLHKKKGAILSEHAEASPIDPIEIKE